MNKKFFIDTNIFVNWIILKQINNKTYDQEKNKDLWKEFKRFESSYRFLEKVIEIQQKDTFFTDMLAIHEILYCLIDEYKCTRMNKDGVPLCSWGIVKNRIKLSEEDKEDIIEEVSFLFYKYILDKESINLCEVLNPQFIWHIMTNYDIRTHDSMLLSAAKEAKCHYFVTKDMRLPKNELKKEGIEILDPETALSILKKEKK